MAEACPKAVPAAGPASVASALVEALLAMGVEEAFGVSGGAMAPLWHALSASDLRVRHFRHESGAAFAATEASLATGRPVVVFTTTGPGLTNALTGMLAARGEGAKLLLLSAFSSSATRGRFAIQETSATSMPAGLHEAGPLFNVSRVLEDPGELGAALSAIAAGFERAHGFVAHLAMPTALQAHAMSRSPSFEARRVPAAPVDVRRCVDLLTAEPFVVWLGHGARGAQAEVRAFVERSGAAVMCTARGKGILPETHPQFIGVTGIGGHDSVPERLAADRPATLLVLGSRLGEASSLFDPRLLPRRRIVHVDIDPDMPGKAFPDATTVPVIADVRAFLAALLAAWPERPHAPANHRGPRLAPASPPRLAKVRPEALMAAIQREVVDASDAVVLAESGNAFIWTTHLLRFERAGRYRVSTGFGAMGHAAAGVVGVALATGQRAVAVVGDGSMLMQNEISTAVRFAAPAVWIVLNDARYGMCEQGMDVLGLAADATIPEVDFVAFARAQGADGIRVDDESRLDAALRQAMHASGPFMLDVRIDPRSMAPAGARNKTLASQLDTHGEPSFPLR